VTSLNAIAAISLISAIPAVYGIVFYFLDTGKHRSSDELFGISYKGHQLSLIRLRMAYLFVLSFFTLLLLIRLIDPVPSEGNIRTGFIVMLLSFASVFYYLMLRLSCSQRTCIIILITLIMMFVLMIFGLKMYKPWSYLMFVSPFYWTAWAWIIPSTSESAVYSIIALSLYGLIFLAGNNLIKKFR